MSSLERFAQMKDWSALLLRHLNRYSPVPLSVENILSQAILRHLDSEMLIQDSYIPFAPLPEAANRYPLPFLACLPVFSELIDAIRREGFGRYFYRLTSLFGHIMLKLSGSEKQNAEVADWVANGLSGAFLMTDRGGASVMQWKSLLQVKGERWQISLDKQWAIGAVECGFAIVVVACSGKMIPQALLIPPQACALLQREPIGLPYLDRTVQLGNCKGHLSGDASWALRHGGLLAVKQFLTVVRPRFVQALMGHLFWLERQTRLSLSTAQQEMREYIETLAVQLGARQYLTALSEDEVMALKFASNALLFDLVESGRVNTLMDERDLLGFTKMEGSSYRCLLEIYSRHKRLRHG